MENKQAATSRQKPETHKRQATNIAIFASGNGSNAENIINYFNNSENIKVGLVLTNNPHAYVLERARRLGVPTVIFNRTDLTTDALLGQLKRYGIDYIVLAGFLLLIPENLIDAYPDRIINIHPALLPKYGGKGMFGDRVHEAVTQSGDLETGITIHYVNNKYDEGKVIFQAKCPLRENDTPQTVAQKVHALEYEHYPKIIASVIKNN